MLKKIVIILSSIMLLVAGFLYWFSLQSQITTSFQPTGLVPPDAAVILKINKVADFLAGARSFNDKSLLIQKASKFSVLLQYLDSINSDKPTNIKNGWSSAFVSAHLVQNNELSYMLYLDSEKYNVKNIIEDFSKDIKLLNEHTYDGNKIYSIRLIYGKDSIQLYVASMDKVILISDFRLLIEQSIRQKFNQLQADYYDQLFQLSGKNVDASLLIHLPEIVRLGKGKLNELFRRINENTKGIGDYSVLDIFFKDASLLLTGFTTAKDNTQALGLFQQQKPVEIKAIKLLPDFIHSFVMVSNSDPNLFNQSMKSFMIDNGKGAGISYNSESEPSVCMKLFASNIDSIKSGEWGLAFSSLPDTAVFGLIGVAEGIDAEMKLKDIFEKDSKNQSGFSVESFQILNRRVHIYQIDSNCPYFAMQTGSIFQNYSFNYMMALDQFIVFSKEKEALKSFVHAYLKGDKLLLTKEFKAGNHALLPKTNFMVYGLGVQNALKNFLFDEEKLKVSDFSFGNVASYGMQINHQDNMFFTHLFFNAGNQEASSPQVIRKIQLDSSVSSKPFLILNPIDGSYDLLIQDETHQIYFIDKKGSILWKKQLDEPILGKVFTIDYYRNQKSQLFFNTSKRIHLIDRIGNYVTAFPISFKVQASAGMLVLDYENDKNYRVYIPLSDRRLVCLNKECALVEGWLFNKAENLIDKEISYFKVGDRDFLLFNDTRKTYILDRKGQVRIQVRQETAVSKNNSYHIVNSGAWDDFRFITTDTMGRILSIMSDGTVKRDSLGVFSRDHFFQFTPSGQTGQGEYIIADGKQLYIYTLNKKLVKAITYKGLIASPINNYPDGLLGMFVRDEGQIYMYNKDYELLNGFPIPSTGFFEREFSKGEYKNLIYFGSNQFFLYTYSF